MSDEHFNTSTSNINKRIMTYNETPRRKTSMIESISSLRNKSFILNHLFEQNRKSFNNNMTSTCEEQYYNTNLSNMESPSCNLKAVTIANLGVSNIKCLLGKSTPVVLNKSNDVKNQKIYLKKYKFPQRIWPICNIINNYIKQDNKIDQISDIIEKLLKYVYKDCGFFHKDTAAVLLLSSQVHYKLKFYKTALLSAERALEIFQFLHGEIYIGCCVTYQLIAMICKTINDKKGSMYCLKKAISILKIIFGSTYLEIGKLHNNIGVLFEEERMFSNAIENYTISQQIFIKQEKVNNMYIFNVEVNILRASYLQFLFNKETLKTKVFHLLEELKKELLSSDLYEVFDNYLSEEQKINFIAENIKNNNDTNNVLNNLKKLIIYYLRNNENEDKNNKNFSYI
ncbi:Tetratricopeptide-like helical domain-containing protein [Strongyloides ratti]|uniref:Tetratricopeptide-like helical domain-containing protein n=1 Tax=Strongyloides ratti TaxID=34506 RepID=A0A090MSJ9_STRRB|nr:Tetratricopeptide-like helical domain-containing protein [Strongyloides ratti]CEF61228.1 Tetratricopeptide-like helical domain-containing protein [Strongyloides ratti]